MQLYFQRGLQCEAKSKHSGVRCKSYAVNGYKVCRMHGAGGGAPKGERNGMYRHGIYTKEAIAERKATRELIKTCKNTLYSL